MRKVLTIFTTTTLLILLILLLPACKSTQKAVSDDNGESALAALMTGSYNSAQQAATDSNYFDISLHMYSIWADRPGQWLYVEQAVTRMATRPYRQRIYKVEAVGLGEWRSVVYEIEKPERFIGKWKEPSFFDQFDNSILIDREGCAVYLKKDADGNYTGSTRADECKSDFRGAAYATSIVTIRKDGIESWDRGFDANGKYLWGAEFGPYQFDKIE